MEDKRLSYVEQVLGKTGLGWGGDGRCQEFGFVVLFWQGFEREKKVLSCFSGSTNWD